jgi:tRNA nucleotidyltransferase/poly(A) polymerase
MLNLFETLAAVEPPAYIVGGAVRDALLRRRIKDVDIAVPGSGLRTARQIADLMNGAYYPLDPKRDVGRALVETPEGKLVIDAARFRGDSLLADLTDRDFTVNAMAVDIHGNPGWLIDPSGGEQDAIDKVLRRCNAHSIAQDPIRSLRAVRLSIMLGLRIEPATLADCRAHGARMSETSPERVRDEVFRLLALPKAASALRVADALGLTAAAFPEVQILHARSLWQHALLQLERLAEIVITISPMRTDETAARFSLGMLVMALDRYRPQLQRHLDTQWPEERTHPALLGLAVLLLYATDADGAEARAAALPLSSKERERLSLIVRHYEEHRDPSDLTPLGLHRYWHVVAEAGIDICLIALAEFLASASVLNDQDEWLARLVRARTLLEAYFDHYDRIVQPPTLIDGNQLMSALDLRPGPTIGSLLDAIREAQVTGMVTTTEGALAFARGVLGEA